ncbi:MAG TPA: hypothetical protein VKI65_16950 [Gemmataceae bacterium]|nr:hypothetical protein [Gemmataceae bacterium]
MRLILGMGAALALLVLVGNVRAEEANGKVALDSVPKAVKQAAQAQYPQAQIQSAEVQEQSGQTVYTLTLKQGDRERKVRIAMRAVILTDTGRAIRSPVETPDGVTPMPTDELTPAPTYDDTGRRRFGLRRDRGGERRFALMGRFRR